MTDLRRMAEELLTLGAVRDAIENEYKRRHAALQAEYEKNGVTGQRIVAKDGSDFGKVSVPADSVVVEIMDRDAMEDWLLHVHRSEAIERTTYDINPPFWRLVEEASRKAGYGIDPSTKERLDWIRVRVVKGTMRATATTTAKAAVRQLIRDTGVRFELEAE